MTPMTPQQFQAETGVSDAVLARLEIHADLLRKWQKRINLVGSGTLADLWRRHFLDSAQLLALIPKGARVLVDLGSGAGFPGLVLAAIGDFEVHLIDSDARKGVFLREAARAMGLRVTVHTGRIEAMAPIRADVVTSRALAPLTDLLALALAFTGPETVCLIPKGKGAQDELTAAGKEWTMAATATPSATDPAGVLLSLSGLARQTKPDP